MTAIWDILGSKARELSKTFDHEQTIKLKKIMGMIYECIKIEPEYANLKDPFSGHNLLLILRSAQEQKWNESVCEHIGNVVSELHDFDHRDLLFSGKLTHGHHTEMVLTQRKNKKIMKGFENIYYNSWWIGELE